MIIYRVQGDNSTCSIVDCKLTLQEKLPILESLRDRTAVGTSWIPLSCRKVGDSPLGHFADFNLVGGMPVVFPQTLQIPEVDRWLRDDAELLPIAVDGQDAFGLNVTRILDACDRSKSRMHKLPDGQLTTHWPVFRRSAVTLPGLFRIMECQTRLYLSEPSGGGGFYADYQRLGLTGLTFEEQPMSD